VAAAALYGGWLYYLQRAHVVRLLSDDAAQHERRVVNFSDGAAQHERRVVDLSDGAKQRDRRSPHED
jgi:hypothetical protein